VLIDQADVEIIKLNIGGMLVDISIKQLGGLCTLDFMKRVSRKVGKQHLLKKSIIMLKSWMTYEACLLGSHAANMATYALYIIVIFLLNNFYNELETPLDVFRKYFEYFGSEQATFDWDDKMLTIFGPVKTLNF
jgi:DNA polymerase sigma